MMYSHFDIASVSRSVYPKRETPRRDIMAGNIGDRSLSTLPVLSTGARINFSDGRTGDSFPSEGSL
jgi:hypothetical protein